MLQRRISRRQIIQRPWSRRVFPRKRRYQNRLQQPNRVFPRQRNLGPRKQNHNRQPTPKNLNFPWPTPRPTTSTVKTPTKPRRPNITIQNHRQTRKKRNPHKIHHLRRLPHRDFLHRKNECGWTRTHKNVSTFTGNKTRKTKRKPLLTRQETWRPRQIQKRTKHQRKKSMAKKTNTSNKSDENREHNNWKPRKNLHPIHNKPTRPNTKTPTRFSTPPSTNQSSRSPKLFHANNKRKKHSRKWGRHPSRFPTIRKNR